MSGFTIKGRFALLASCAVGAIGAWALALAAPAAASEPAVVCGGGICSETYEATGEAQSFTVPAFVSSLALDVSGAGGGGGFGAPGGNGARLAARFPVSSGSTLTFVVGRRGEFTSGGYGGGGQGAPAPFEEGMGGGGGSFVFSEAGLLIAAGGGGGAGGTTSGGAGAWNGVNGSVSGESPFWDETESGLGGKQTGGGQGGTHAGSGAGPTATPAIEGAGGAGGLGGLNGGGGGGGGYYGGGGGGTQGSSPFSNGGGGGGADFLSEAGENASFENGGGGQGGPGALYGGFMGVDGDIVVSWREIRDQPDAQSLIEQGPGRRSRALHGKRLTHPGLGDRHVLRRGDADRRLRRSAAGRRCSPMRGCLPGGWSARHHRFLLGQR